MVRFRRWISSMKSTSRGPSAVRIAAMSPLRSSAGPATCRIETPSSRRMICASDVLPSPGGPASRTWSSASPRPFAAASAIASCSFTRSCPTKSASIAGGASARAPPRPPSLTVAASDRSLMPPARSAWRTCSSTGSDSSTPASARSASSRLKPSSTSASRASRFVAPRRTSGSPRAELVGELDHDALRDLASDPGDRLEAGEVAAGDRAAQLLARRGRDDRERHLRADARDGEQQLEERALVGVGEPVQLQRVVADVRGRSRP